MSEFDKEAERERLREKFADEADDRASAQHMSELLLQGMTMTNRHCPECGNPLFSDGDRVFCPECEREVVEEASDETPEETATQPNAPQQPEGEPDQGPRRNLEVALQRSAAAAAAAEDPRVVREHLEAARAAIDALQAFDTS